MREIDTNKIFKDANYARKSSKFLCNNTSQRNFIGINIDVYFLAQQWEIRKISHWIQLTRNFIPAIHGYIVKRDFPDILPGPWSALCLKIGGCCKESVP